MTILEDSRNGVITEEIRQISQTERISDHKLLNDIANGRIIIMKNERGEPLGIGNSLRTKINVNLGTSSSEVNIEKELQKIQIVGQYGGDTISDLSMGGDIEEIRKIFMENSSLPITSVPIYQIVAQTDFIGNITEEKILKSIEHQIDAGISSIVIHAGFTLEEINRLIGKRIMGMVSKGGSMTASIMQQHKIGNPFLSNFEYILDMMKERDVVLNLGNAMRSGCIHDKIDEFHINEIRKNIKLAKIANEKGIQVIIESLGGHLTLKELISWIKKHKKLTNSRPLFVSGPLPIDIGVGYDHISAAIGATFASGFGADYLCAITPAEHLKLPSPEEIKEGLIACRIAAHSGDSLKFGLNHLFDDDLSLAKNRFIKNWEAQLKYCIDPEKFKKLHPTSQKECSMCGKYCALSFWNKSL